MAAVLLLTAPAARAGGPHVGAASSQPAASATQPLGADGRPAVLVLAYHRVSESPASSGGPYAVPRVRLEEQLQYLRSTGYSGIDPLVWAQALDRKTRVEGRRVILTFDDGYPSDHTIAAPLLEKYGYRGVFFVVTSRLRGVDVQAYRALAARGHWVGSHTVHHYYLTKKQPSRTACGRVGGCSDADIITELERSRHPLGEGAPTRLLAWPGNYYDARTIALARKAGYRALFAAERQTADARGRLVGVPGTTTSADEIFRVQVDGRCTLTEFRRAVREQRGCVHSGRTFHRYFIPQCPARAR